MSPFQNGFLYRNISCAPAHDDRLKADGGSFFSRVLLKFSWFLCQDSVMDEVGTTTIFIAHVLQQPKKYNEKRDLYPVKLNRIRRQQQVKEGGLRVARHPQGCNFNEF